jgi:hypothetical protein
MLPDHRVQKNSRPLRRTGRGTGNFSGPAKTVENIARSHDPVSGILPAKTAHADNRPVGRPVGYTLSRNVRAAPDAAGQREPVSQKGQGFRGEPDPEFFGWNFSLVEVGERGKGQVKQSGLGMVGRKKSQEKTHDQARPDKKVEVPVQTPERIQDGRMVDPVKGARPMRTAGQAAEGQWLERRAKSVVTTRGSPGEAGLHPFGPGKEGHDLGRILVADRPQHENKMFSHDGHLSVLS